MAQFIEDPTVPHPWKKVKDATTGYLTNHLNPNPTLGTKTVPFVVYSCFIRK